MSMQKLVALGCVVSSLVVAGCGDDSASAGSDAAVEAGPSTGCSKSTLASDDSGIESDAGIEAPAADAGADAGPPAPTFKEVYDQVIAANTCDSAFCHGGTASGGLVLLEDVAYENLVGAVSAGEECSCKTSKLLVAPGKPDASLLVEKIEEAEPSCGTQMPPPGTQAAVTQEQIDLVRAWIAAGAKQ